MSVDYIAAGLTVNTIMYDIALGQGIVTRVNVNLPLPIEIKFDLSGKVIRYNRAGELFPGSLQTLYYSAPVITGGITPSVDWTKVAGGTAINVSTDNITFIGATFIGYHPTNAHPYLATATTIPLATDAIFYQYAQLV